MASKWLAAFRATEDAPLSTSGERAVSAVSANSPSSAMTSPPIGPFGTIGTSKQKEERAEAAKDDLEERAAIIECGAGVPGRWAEGFAALSTMSAPTGFTSPRWQRIIDATGTFLDRWAAEAIRCDWSDLDVFGCNPDRPDARFDCMGLVLLLDRCEITGIDEGGADLVTATGARQRYRRRPLPGDTISLWDVVTTKRGRDAG
jgi:hypothetical protein